MVSLLRESTPKLLQKLKAQSRRGDMGHKSREKNRKLALAKAENPLGRKQILPFRNLENLPDVYCPIWWSLWM